MGELARKPGCPELADTPLGLLTARPGEGFTIFDKLFAPTAGVIFGFTGAMLYNVVRKRPVWAGIHQHFFSGGVGYFIGSKIQESKFAARAERDAILKHYITLHPEDFPPFEKQRYADIYYPFKPIR